jgi:integrase/recombinase XerD
LAEALRVMAPRADTGWLRRAAARLEAVAIPIREKRTRLQTPRGLWELGFAMMAEAEAAAQSRDVRRASRFHDGLIIAVLAARPMRRQTLLRMQVERHLLLQETSTRISFAADEVKERRPYERELPAELTRPIRRYLAVWRPLLLGERVSEYFWISEHGDRLSADRFYAMVTEVTTTAFGRPMSPHMFRDAAATAIATDVPAEIGIAMPILNHSSVTTISKHYIMPGSVPPPRRTPRSSRPCGAGFVERVLEVQPEQGARKKLASEAMQ